MSSLRVCCRSHLGSTRRTIFSSRSAPSFLENVIHRRSTGILAFNVSPRSSCNGLGYLSGPTSREECSNQFKQRQHKRDYHTTKTMSSDKISSIEWHRAFIAIGSNIGYRLGYLEDACKRLEAVGSIRVVRTSGLWETKPMYVEDQGIFLNGVVEVSTSLQPMDLLDVLQAIENDIGRKKLIDKGPRSIDLDILLYDDLVFDSARLTIPHKLMLERGFVLGPLCELVPHGVSPISGATFSEHLRKLPQDGVPPTTTVELHKSMPALTPGLPGRSTIIMSVLNVTPDSFSDGGQYPPDDETILRQTISEHVSMGASIIDIGGQSTRPRAAPVSAAEECARVLPAIRIAREVIASHRAQDRVAISVDTYRAEVAEAAVHAGAHIINDVSAGKLDPAMLQTVGKLGCTVVLMHMRGDPATMMNTENTTYADGLIQSIGQELRESIAAAEAAGVRRWRMILDPGIGFAKKGAQNVEILRRLAALRAGAGLDNMPWLVGTSRKGFIGKITGVQEASERVWGTAAAVSSAIAGGAEIVRVHDVREMGQVARMADAIWRGQDGTW